MASLFNLALAGCAIMAWVPRDMDLPLSSKRTLKVPLVRGMINRTLRYI